MTDMYVADGGEPLWVTFVWLALKFLVVWLALRVAPPRALLATIAMVIASTVIVLAWDATRLVSLPLLPDLVLGVVVQTAIEAAVLVWAFRVIWTRRFALLLAANVMGLALSVVTAVSSDINRASSAYVVPVGATRADVIRAAGGPSLERPVETKDFACSSGGVRALEYHAPVGVIAKLLPLADRWPGSPLSIVTICLDEDDKVVTTELVELN